MKKKIGRFLFLLILFSLGYSKGAEATSISSPIFSITGNAFQDINNNGEFDHLALEIPIKNTTVSLYRTMEDAQNESNIVTTKKTNSLGAYTFSKLTVGDYYIRYQTDSTNYAPSNIENTSLDGSGIIPVTITSNRMVYTQHLSFKKIVDLNVIPFSDHNQNGQQDEGESILDGQTLIVLDVLKFYNTIKNDLLSSIDVEKIVSGALQGGNIDLVDGIYLRTSANGQAITLPDVDSGAYIAMRSPFNLTLRDTLANTDKIKAIIEMINGGDIQTILNTASLLSTGDITTNNDNTYLQALVNIFPKIYQAANKIDYEAILGEDHATTVTTTLNNLNTINTLLSDLPAFRVAIIDYFGNSYDFTGLKVKQTNNLFFGIKEYATLKGSVFLDNNNDGVKGPFELTGDDTRVIVYNENGEELASAATGTTSLSYTLKQLPYNTTLYLAIETDKPFYPRAETSTLPENLKDKKIVGSYIIYHDEIEVIKTQDIGLISSTTTVSASVKSIDSNQNTATITFKNTDKTNDTTITYLLNNTLSDTFELAKSSIFSSGRTVDKDIPFENEVGENVLNISWKKGVYTIDLDPLLF